ncbi:hypothetical protein SAY86_004523 [Trapa natans]|uniref:Uncharacterized protein n=1 Tax=Trapa natans TaxID=22666 RepID=A0AAN7RNW9_TRANT|nr:hypothetical protein SAY86_004523 [Trapa natans]
MGICSSLNYCCAVDLSEPTARVISASGVMHEYVLPITVSKVLKAEISAASSSSRSSALFLCNSDELNYEELIPEMDPEVPLVNNQIYFALPKSRLAQRLSASHMAALAVKASLALSKDGGSKGSQIFPVLEITRKGNKTEISEKQLPPAPVRNYQRSPSSNGFKSKAARSFRTSLSTIHEGCESVYMDQSISLQWLKVQAGSPVAHSDARFLH